MSEVKRQVSQEEALSKRRLRLWLRILKVSRLMTNELRENLRDSFESTLPRFDVMSALYREERGLKMSEVSSALKVSNGNVTGIVDRLVDEGLVVRVQVKEDRRATVVRLTRKGRAHFAVLAARHERWVNSLLCGANAGDTDHLILLLDRVVSALESREADHDGRSSAA